MATIRASYTISAEDVGAWMKYWRENDSRRKRFSRVIRVVGFASAIYLAFRTAQYQSNSASAVSAFIVTSIILIGILAAACLTRRDWSRLASRYVPEELSPSVYGRHELQLDEFGIRVENDFGKTEVKWSAISRIGETDSHVFLYLAPNQAIVIPAASLSGASLAEIKANARSSAAAAA